jgi:hypothetical protein
MRLLDIDTKKWSMDRELGPINPQEVASRLLSGDGGT